MQPVPALRSLDGVARFAELTALSVSRRALRAAVAAGDVIRAREGVYRLPDLDPELAAAVAVGGKIAGATALRRLGLWLLDEGRRPISVWIPASSNVRVPLGRMRVYRDRAWPDDGRREVTVLHALRQLASECSGADVERAQERLIVAVESALNRRLIVVDDLDRLHRDAPAAAHAVLDAAVASSQSGLESLVRWRLQLMGIRTQAQHSIRADLVDLLVGTSLILELDGRAFHDFEDDHERDNDHAIEGFVTLRWTHKMVLTGWPRCRAALESRMSRGLHLL
ncbi:type IV toxin-antitoxin system AbiEi family antitoxin domain-containing protein [Microbacteriaceae bacterium VKM Ac-2854]|nr:type IV toxin-antitoxin system AbiEi family antitoxin domain-containing protein [Microbacteriaceae bacterium VKM Ac-2854]